MEENQSPSLFGLSIDQTAKSHLSEAARWAKFLAIVGFIFIGIIALAGFFAGSVIGTMMGNLPRNEYAGPSAGMLGSFVSVIYVAIALVYFFPCLFLFHFGNKMKQALNANDQDALSSSFQNLKKMLRFLGILTIIGLALVVIEIIFVLVMLGTMR
ncbi:MAG: DUF5362 family protein [Chitinophagaceae bacterium]